MAVVISNLFIVQHALLGLQVLQIASRGKHFLALINATCCSDDHYDH